MIRIFLILILLFFPLLSKEIDHFTLAQDYEQKGDIKKALDQYFLAAQKRDSNAILYLGKLYYEGKYLPRSVQQAVEYLQKAALLENDQAKYNLAIIYASSKNKRFYDIKKAYDIFLELGIRGHAGAQNRLGMFYTYGLGVVEIDYKEAVKWFEASAKQCYESAECHLAFMYVNGKGVWKNFGRAHSFAKKGYKNGNPICTQVWKKYNLYKYPEDNGFKFDFFTKPCP